MGNNQSTSDRTCPSSRLCRVFYLGMGPSSSEDSDEWFGVLPRERKQKKKSYSQRNLTVMPVVPEVSIFIPHSQLEFVIVACMKITKTYSSGDHSRLYNF
jgi:hypothetical protein